MPETKFCTLKEMVEAMTKWPDDTVFRWFQMSYVNEKGETYALDTMCVTLKQVRLELGIIP